MRIQAQELANKAAPSVQAQMSSAAKSIGDKAGVADMSLRVGELRMGEIFDETPTSISLLAMTKYSVVAGGKQMELPMTMAMTTMLLHGKIVYFYACSVLKSPADTEWVRAQTKAWVPRALAANR
ncbi:MAG: hypothetical protein M3Z16_03945 [Pseudomonadota bacterium]|nr:hypothetical protein [Pseudomonadota bacterium]